MALLDFRLPLGEDRKCFEQLRSELLQEIQPRNAIEEFWASQVLDAAWQLRRLMNARAAVYERSIQRSVQILLTDDDLEENVGYRRGAFTISSRYPKNRDSAVELVQNMTGNSPEDLLLNAYGDAVPSMMLVDRAIDIVSARHDRALSNIYRNRELAALPGRAKSSGEQ